MAVLAAAVTVGMGIPAYYRYKVTDLGKERDRILAEAPKTADALAAKWFEFMEPQVLTVLKSTRFSHQFPYLVSHVMAPRSADEPPEVWGVPASEITRGVTVVQEGTLVRVILPEPRIVARDVLVGDKAFGVQVFQPGEPPSDARVLLRNRVEWVLKKTARSYEKHIEGGFISVEVGGLVRPRPTSTPSNLPSDSTSEE